MFSDFLKEPERIFGDFSIEQINKGSKYFTQKRLLKFAVNNFSIEKKQQDEGVSCLKIDTPVEDGFSGGPVINSEGKIVGIVVSGENNNCLAISVQQIYKFLETAEAVYKKKRNLGKHGLKMKISETETDGQTTLSQFFEITDYDESNDVFNSQFKESLHHAF